MTDPVADRHWTCACRLRERRRQLGLTQAEVVARAAGSGTPLTNRTLSAMEHGRGLDLGRLPDLAAALDCTVTYLMGLTADPVRWEPDPPGRASAGGPATSGRVPDTPETTWPGASPGTARHHWILGPDLPIGTGPRHAVDGDPPPP